MYINMLPVYTLCAQWNHLRTQLLIQYTFRGLSGRLGSVSLRSLSLQSSSVLTKATWIFWDPSSPRLVYTSPSADLCPAFFSLRLLHCPLEASNASPPKVLWCYCLNIQILLTESFTSLLSQPYVFCWNEINWTGTEDKPVISRSLYLKIQI